MMQRSQESHITAGYGDDSLFPHVINFYDLPHRIYLWDPTRKESLGKTLLTVR
jgi:hypothetical protein